MQQQNLQEGCWNMQIMFSIKTKQVLHVTTWVHTLTICVHTLTMCEHITNIQEMIYTVLYMKKTRCMWDRVKWESRLVNEKWWKCTTSEWELENSASLGIQNLDVENGKIPVVNPISKLRIMTEAKMHHHWREGASSSRNRNQELQWQWEMSTLEVVK